jgi:ferritin-like metal-binding protein YciE
MSGKLENLNDLLEHELQDLFSAENQLTEALPKWPKQLQTSS